MLAPLALAALYSLAVPTNEQLEPTRALKAHLANLEAEDFAANDIVVPAGPRVVLHPSLACTFDEMKRRVAGGDKVKITIMFRGREQHRPELGYRLLQRLAQDVEELGFVESAPKQDGRNMTMVIGPHKKKSEAKAEVKAERAEKAAERAAEKAAERAERTAVPPTDPGEKKERRRSENLDPDM